MDQELADPQDVAACLEKVRATMAHLDDLQASLKQRAIALAASAEDITERLRSFGLDTPEAIEDAYNSLDEDVKASAQAAPMPAPMPVVSAAAHRSRHIGRMV